MKKFYFSILMTAAVVLSSVPCEGRDLSGGLLSGVYPKAGIRAKARVSESAAFGQAGLKEGIPLKTDVRKKAPARSAAAGELITQAPAGEVHSSLVRSSSSFFVEFGAANMDEVDAMVGEFVVGDDGYIYVKNPFAYDVTGTYMKLRVDGDVAVAEFPQLIDRDDVYGMGTEEDLYVERLKFDATEQWYVPDEENRQIVFDYKDGVLSQRYEEDVMYGLVTSDGDWLGYGDWNLVMRPLDEAAVVLPEGVEAKEYTLVHANGASLVKVAFDGNDVYLQGLNATTPDACVKGTLKDNSVLFDAGQYLGTYALETAPEKYLDYHVFFMPAVIGQVWDEWMEEYVEVYEATNEIVFDFNPETGVLSSDDVIMTNASQTQTYYVEAFEQPCLKPYAGKKPAVPAAPIVTEFLPIEDHFGDGDIYGGISFVLLGKDVDGNYIDVHDLCYNVIVNDELFTFTPDEFINLTEDMVDVPYDFNDDFDFQVNGIYHNVYFTNPDYVKIGVRAKYVVDGVANVSDVAYYGVNTGAEKVDAQKEVVSVTYTDMLGRKVNRPSAGLYIKTQTYSDGTARNDKVVVR